MAATHLHLFQSSVIDESKIHKLIANHFLLDRAMLQWCPITSEHLPRPNMNEIVVFYSFQHGFGLPTYDFFRGLLDHYHIELVYHNPNSILQITIFIHLYEAFLGIPHNFPLFKNYFFFEIRAGFHVGQFLTAVVDTEASRENIEALYISLKTTQLKLM
jgi:hypothetical protein